MITRVQRHGAYAQPSAGMLQSYYSPPRPPRDLRNATSARAMDTPLSIDCSLTRRHSPTQISCIVHICSLISVHHREPAHSHKGVISSDFVVYSYFIYGSMCVGLG